MEHVVFHLSRIRRLLINLLAYCHYTGGFPPDHLTLLPFCPSYTNMQVDSKWTQSCTAVCNTYQRDNVRITVWKAHTLLLPFKRTLTQQNLFQSSHRLLVRYWQPANSQVQTHLHQLPWDFTQANGINALWKNACSKHDAQTHNTC